MTRPNKLECLYLAITFQSSLTFAGNTGGLYYKHVIIVNYASSGVNKLKASLNDDARVIIYDRHMLIVQVTEAHPRRKHQKGAPIGLALALPSNSKTRLERVSKDKPFSLLGLVVSDEGKKFYIIDT
jgi:hypothetical protein